jgi:hypothetical protein
MAFTVTVPNVPGVPSVVRAVTAAVSLPLLTADAILGFAGSLLIPQWGIFLGGLPVVLADNVTSFGYQQQWAVADFPIEAGGFETYDKVSTPFRSRFRFTAGGSEANRLALLASLEAIAGTTTLYNVVTPEKVYLNVTIDSYDYNRTAQSGVGLLAVDVSVTEVRVAVANSTTGGLTNTQDPSSVSAVDGGTVQTTTATASQAARIGPIAAAGG